MADLNDLLKLVGDPVAGQVPGAAIGLGAKLSQLPGEDETAPLMGERRLFSTRSGLDAKLMAPRAYVESTDLSLWPGFSNAGSYLRSHEALPKWLDNGLGEFATNVALDPINLLLFGSGGILGKTIEGAGASIITAASEGGRITSGAATMAKVVDSLEAAAKIAGRSEDIIAAAKGGKTKLVKQIVDEALATGKLHEKDAELLKTLRSEAKGLGRVLEDTDKLAAREVTPADLLGETYRERVRLGQVRPFVSVIKPDWKNPVKAIAEVTGAYDIASLPLHFLGIEVGGHATWTPTSKLFSAAFDAVGIGGMRGPAVEIAEEMRPGALLDKIDAIASSAAKSTEKEISPYHYGVSARRALLTAGMPMDAVLKDVTGYDLTDKQVEKLFRRTVGIGRPLDQPVTEEEIGFMRGLVRKQAEGELSRFGAESKLARSKMMDDLMTQTRTEFGRENARRASLGLQQLDSAMLKADIHDLIDLDHVMSLEGILADPLSPGGGLVNRSSLAATYASNTTALGRTLLMQAYDRDTANAINRTLDMLVTHSDRLVENEAGRLVLADAKDTFADAPQLAQRLKENPEVAHLLTGEGLDPAFGEIMRWQRVALDTIGKTLAQAGTIAGMHSHYFPMVFKPSGKFWEMFGLAPRSETRFLEMGLERGPQGTWVRPAAARVILGDTGEAGEAFLSKLRQGKVSLQEARQWTEEMAVRAEAEGLGTYKRDGLGNFGRYLHAAAQAQLVDRLWRDLPRLPLGVTEDMLLRDAPELARNVSRETLNGAHRFYDDEKAIPKGMEGLYQPISITPRWMRGAEDVRAVKSAAEAAAVRELESSGMGSVLRETSPAVVSAKDRVAKLDAALQRIHDQGATRAKEAWDDLGKWTGKATEGAARDVSKIGRIAGRAVDSLERLAARDEAAAERAAKAMLGRAQTVSAKSRSVMKAADEAAERSMVKINRTIDDAERLIEGGSPAAKKLAAEARAHLDRAMAAEAEGKANAAALRESAKTALDMAVEASGDKGLQKSFMDAAARYEKQAQSAGTDAAAAALQRARAAEAKAAAQRVADVRDAKAAVRATGADFKAAERARVSARATAYQLRKDAQELVTRASKRRADAARNAELIEKQIDEARSNAAKAIEARENELAAAKASKNAETERRVREALGKEKDALVELDRAKGQVAAVRQKLSSKAEDYAADVMKRAAARESEPISKTIHVWKGDANALREAFRLYEREGYSGFLRAWDNFNNAIRPIVLMGDLFFFGTIGLSGSFLGNPMKSARILGQDFLDIGKVRSGREFLGNSVGKALLGAAGGVALGPLVGAQDSGDYLGLATVGAAYGAAIGTAIRGGKATLESFGHPMAQPVLRRMGLGGWTGRPDDASIGLVQEWIDNILQRVRADNAPAMLAAAEKPLKAIYNSTQWFDGVMWSTLHNNGKIAYFDTMWSRQFPKLEASARWKEATPAGREQMERELSAELVQAGNNVFSSQSYAKLFASPEWDRWSKRFFVAPSWFYSRLQMTSAMMANMNPIKGALVGSALGVGMQLADEGYDPAHFPWKGAIYGAAGGAVAAKWATNVVGRLAAPGNAYREEAWRLAASAIMGGYATYTMLNRAFTGHWMWENEEGHKMEVALPNGMYFHPGRSFTAAWDFAGVKDQQRNTPPALAQIANKLSPALSTMRLVFNRDWSGGPIIVPSDMPWDVAYKYGEYAVEQTAPIGLSQGIETGFESFRRPLQPVDILRSVGGVMGFPLRGMPKPQIPDPTDSEASSALFSQPSTPSLVGTPPLISGRF